MSTGARLLDSVGRIILDETGRRLLDDGAGNHCCCAGSAGSGSGAAPPDCDCDALGDLPSSFAVSPASWSACGECGTVASGCPDGYSVWDGSVSGGGDGFCQWSNDNCTTTTDHLQLQAVLELVIDEGTPCFWRLTISCLATATVIIWQGKKLTGASPAGNYLQSAGCGSGVASVMVS